jgi:nitrite reductase (NO-forming)
MIDDTTPRLSKLAAQLADSPRTRDRGEDSDHDRPVLVLGAPSAISESLLTTRTDRRAFLARASALSLAIPGIGAALTACSPKGSNVRDTAGTVAADSGADTAAHGASLHHHQNSDSKLDSSVLRQSPHDNTSAAGGVAAGAPSTTYHRYDPALPPRQGAHLQLHWHTREVPLRISDDTVVAAWTFEGDIPGPIVHCHVGDTVEFTLTNDSAIPHSMDFHAAQVNPKEAFKSVMKGQSHSFTYKPKYAGAFLYHCGTGPVLMHIGSGMFGAIIVSPREGLPPAKEFVLVQNEYYLADAANGVRASDYPKMLNMLPDIVCFNGRPNQYVKEPIRVKVGDRVRFWVVSAGPSHPCNFHVVGEQFDTVYLASPPGGALRGVQTFSVPPGGGMVFELVCDVPGEFPFVNHGFGHGQKGAIGFLDVED